MAGDMVVRSANLVGSYLDIARKNPESDGVRGGNEVRVGTPSSLNHQKRLTLLLNGQSGLVVAAEEGGDKDKGGGDNGKGSTTGGDKNKCVGKPIC